MKTVIAHLNAVIEGRMPTGLKPEACRKALWAIESQELAVNALRIWCGAKTEEGAAEAYQHAMRYLALHDKQMAERVVVVVDAAPPQTAAVEAMPTTPRLDISDLV